MSNTTNLPSRARALYRRHGLRPLCRRGAVFAAEQFCAAVLWRVLPRDRTLAAISRSRVLTAVYFMFRGTFYHEQRSVLCGLAKHHELEGRGAAPRHRLVRGVHRIEKGLSMRDRRDVFAESYVGDVVADLESEWCDDPDRQLRWAVDVLVEYFGVVSRTDAIERAAERFEAFLDAVDYEPGDRVPYPRRDVPEAPVSQAELQQLARRRTSTRWFEQRPVPRDALDDALRVARQSPSACNRQSWEFRFFDEPELVEDVASLAIGANGYDDNIPCLAVLVGKQRAYNNDRDKHVIYIDASLAAMALQFSLEAQGLASCCINWPAIPRNQRRMAERLDLDRDESVVMLMAIGYPDPDGTIPYSAKKPVEELRSFNRPAG